MSRLNLLALTIVVGSMALLPSSAGAASRVAADFNDDGVNDVAIGGPDEDGAVLDTGGVNVIYGVSGLGLDDPGNQYWTQGANGLLETAEQSDAFGNALAAGDFNGDGVDDLAVGALGEDLTAAGGGDGAVHVIYGVAGVGLDDAGNQFFSQGAGGILGAGGNNDNFAVSLAAGDLNGDGADDLVSGVYNEEVSGIGGAGGFHAIYGVPGVGLDDQDNQLWTQDSGSIEDSAELSDHFGETVAVGDFNDDGYGDVVAGSVQEDVGAVVDAGGVGVIFGSAAGLTDAGDQFLTQDSPGIGGASQTGDIMGETFAVGDMDGDGVDDLAVGAFGENFPGGADEAGMVNMIYGAAGVGLTDVGDQLWHQNSTGIPGIPELFDGFGKTLTAGDFDNDGADDLAIGAPEEDVAGVTDSGTVTVLYGIVGTGLDDVGNQGWDQDVPSVKNQRQSGDRFGGGLSAGDFDGDGFDDLLVGIPFEFIAPTVPIVPAHGAIATLPGGAGAGLSANGDRIAHQDTPGILDTADQDDHWGEALLGDDES